jgi:hypothetical protein
VRLVTDGSFPAKVISAIGQNKSNDVSTCYEKNYGYNSALILLPSSLQNA